MCRCEKHQTIFSSKLFVLYVNQYKIVFYGQIPLQKASDVKRLSLELVKLTNADFNTFCFAASLIKNYDAVISAAEKHVLITNIHVSVRWLCHSEAVYR